MIRNDLNHSQWLETVPEDKRKHVQGAVAAWNASADEFNSWDELGWDERDAALQTFIEGQERGSSAKA